MFDREFYYNWTDLGKEYNSIFEKETLSPMIKNIDRTLKEFFILKGSTLVFRLEGSNAQKWIDKWFQTKKFISNELKSDYYSYRKKYAGVTLRESVNEDWSQKYKNSIDCNNPKGFSQKAHCAGKNESMNLEEKLNLFLEKNVPTDPQKWAASIAAAKKKFDVYPSAYANGWAAKNYKEKGGGWKVAKEGVQNNIDEAIHPEVYREFMQACNDAGLNSFQIFGMHVLVYILTLGATGLTILSTLGIAQLAKDAKDTFNNWNAGRKLNPEKIKAIVKDFENKVNKLEGGRKKFFQGIINKMKRTNPENKSALVSINRDLEHYAQAYGIKDESVIKEVEVGQGHENGDDYDELDVEDFEEEDFLNFLKGYTTEINEAEYQGREVKLGKPMQGDVKKFKVYVKNPAGNVVKVNFGHGGTSAAKAGEETMRIRKSNPDARKAFRARHNCDEPGPRTKARYWSCKKW